MTVRPAPAPRVAPAPGLDVVAGAALRLPRLRGWLLFTLAVVGAFFLVIYSRIALDRSAFELADLDTRIAAEESRYWELRLDLARLQAPDRVMRRAEELGMVYPAEVRRVQASRPGAPPAEVDDRWADLKVLLSAQP